MGVGLLECGSRKQSHSGGPPPLTIKMSWPGVVNCQPECGQFRSVWDGAGPPMQQSSQTDEGSPTTDTDKPEVYSSLGVAAHREGNHESAVDLLTRAIAADPENADSHWQ